MKRVPAIGYTLAIIVAVVTAALPLTLNDSQITVYVLLGLATMVVLGISLLMGYAGQVSLGQGAFFAAGAYTAGLMSQHGLPSLLGLVCSPIIASLLALVVGIPILRLRGNYLAFATLAFQMIMISVLSNESWLGGSLGFQNVPQLQIGSFQLVSGRDYAWLTWLAVALLLVVTRNIVKSSAGRGLRALATSEVAAESSGVPVHRYRLIVFVLSAAYAGFAGGIDGYFIGYVAPGSFPIITSIQYVIMAVIGGLGTIWGAVVGAGLITLLTQALSGLGAISGMPAYAPNVLSYAAYSLVLVLGLLYMPRGILPSVTQWLRPRSHNGVDKLSENATLTNDASVIVSGEDSTTIVSHLNTSSDDVSAGTPQD